MGEVEQIGQIKEMLAEERQFAVKQKQSKEAMDQRNSIKKLNKERIAEGKEPIYLKQNQFKEFHLKDKFAKLEETGKLDHFMERQTEKMDKKRARAS